MIANRDAWRWDLDPRDPDYEARPDLPDGYEDEMQPDLESIDDTDPRNDGPMHYQPTRSDV